ncbi:MAG: M18 family aminopeptidase [Acholeplasmatales bacterium]|nr:M18 family aminopeptidase [Acholeplasmatales bacterium]
MVNDLLKFLDLSKTKFQAIDETKKKLLEAGYINVSESDSYKGLNRFFIVRNNSSIICISLPEDFTNKSINIISTHTDSPSFKINENSSINDKMYQTLQTEVYGGPIYSSWFDRPLSIGGRVLTKSMDGTIVQNLIAFKNSICTIPNLCIHFGRDINKGHEYSLDEMKPILSNDADIYYLLKKEYGIEKKDILSFELELFNNMKPTLVGAKKEFFMASRIDNLASHYTALKAFMESACDTFKVFASFDNEEVGSSSMQGAGSSFLYDTLKRFFIDNGYSEVELLRALSNSIAISADNAHAIHPNYKNKSDMLNAPVLNSGFVIKENPSLKYTTDAISKAIIVDLCNRDKIKYQEFHNKPGVAGGSTLGNILQGSVGIHMVDIGLPQLAMHSAYETAGCKDVLEYYKIMKSFYEINLKISNQDIKY